jgi:uncharacterized protein (DUF58 family)
VTHRAPSSARAFDPADASRQRGRRHRFSRGIRFTGQGKLYTAVTLGVGLAAVNTGNNLLFLVLGLMLGLILVSGILSEISLRNIEIYRRLPKTAEAKARFPVELCIRNQKRFFASFGIELRDEIDETLFRRRCFFLRISPGEKRCVAYRCEIEKRGRAFFSGTSASTRFPFGLFEKSRFISLEDSTIVFPETLPVTIEALASGFEEGLHSVQLRGRGLEFLELKEMGPGDDPRRIDWRATARLRKFMVRQSQKEADAMIEIVLDPAPGPGQDPEHNIARAASMIRLSAEKEIPVRLVTPPNVVLECRAPFDCTPLLIHLALINPRQAAASAPPLGITENAVCIGPRAGLHASRSVTASKARRGVSKIGS